MAPSLLVRMLLLWITVESVSAASPQEIAALQSFGAAIGSTGWNFNSDPCSGRWQGVLCCLNKDLDSDCCRPSEFIPNATPPPGFLSDAICNLTSLVILDLNNNFLRGQVPSCIGDRLARLKILGFAGGIITGNIPDEIGKLSNLEELYLDSNRFNGSIPASFGGMTSLKKLSELHLQVNKLTGSIAPLASLTSLTTLNALNNNLSGDLSSTFQNLTSLQVLDLHFNDFTGAVPALDERFPNLTTLNLGFNRLSGTIPASLSKMPSLTKLFLGHNNISGGIGGTSRLEVLDVSHNSLTGALRNLSPQLQVDFSFNSLDINTAPPSLVQTGKGYFNCVPTSSCSLSGDAFSFAITAGGSQDLNNKDGTRFRKDVVANTTGLHYLPDPHSNWALELSGLWTGVLPASFVNAVPAQDDPSLYQSMRWASSYMAYHGSGLENGTYEVTLYFCESVFRNASFRAFDVIIQGEVIAKGLDVAKEVGFLTAHKIRNATVVRDGRLSIEFINKGPDRYLDPNVYRVPSSGAMVSAISVKSLSHRSSGSSTATWQQRRKIAIDTAFGLAYLHDESKHKIIHCDLKPPNILLDDDFTPRIADFGMARLYDEGKSHVTATRMGGTIGYLAPEYAMHYQLSEKADVYSFGVVLLEMISGRRAVDSSRSFEQVVLVEYAYSLASVSTEELLKLLDSRLEGKCDRKEVVDMARVAVLCTLEIPALRPRMRAAWLMLKGTLDIPDIPLAQDSRLSTVRALMSAYEVHSATSSQDRLIALSPR